jgi:hypothetical protein
MAQGRLSPTTATLAEVGIRGAQAEQAAVRQDPLGVARARAAADAQQAAARAEVERSNDTRAAELLFLLAVDGEGPLSIGTPPTAAQQGT